MMVNLTLRNIEIYEATIKDLLRNFAWNFQKQKKNAFNIGKSILLKNNSEISTPYGSSCWDNDQKPELPIIIILSVE